jgi:hypothetical protein
MRAKLRSAKRQVEWPAQEPIQLHNAIDGKQVVPSARDNSVTPQEIEQNLEVAEHRAGLVVGKALAA